VLLIAIEINTYKVEKRADKGKDEVRPRSDYEDPERE
jgi:hypothetical protein